MKKRLAIFLFLLYFIPMSARSEDEPKEPKKNPDSIEVIYNDTLRPFTKLGPLWSSSDSVEKAMKGLKKQAAKLGADAIIEVKVDSKQVGSSSWVYGVEYPQPVLTGWGVKWNDSTASK